jgi:hypothetical protein
VPGGGCDEVSFWAESGVNEVELGLKLSLKKSITNKFSILDPCKIGFHIKRIMVLNSKTKNTLMEFVKT